jgi:hypothetical protein
MSFVRRYRALEEIDRGARREYCDWELAPRVRQEGYNLMLPDVQGLREYGWLLAMRARLELADPDFDRAMETLQTGFALGRDLAEAPILINALVGLAVSHIMLQEVEQWIQTPGSPNLYWALTYLPRPLVDMRTALQGERLWIDGMFPGLRQMLRNPKAGPLGLPPASAPPATLRELMRNPAAGAQPRWHTSCRCFAAKGSCRAATGRCA